MPVQLNAPVVDDLLPIKGVRIGVAQAGIRKANRKDLSVFLLDEGCAVGLCSPRTDTLPLQCRCVASTWRLAPAFAPW